MAKCEVCGREMLTAKGCSAAYVEIDGKRYKRIKYCDPGDFAFGAAPKGRCHDCGAQPGHYHHWGCDAERCPKCGHQFLSCECENVFVTVTIKGRGQDGA